MACSCKNLNINSLDGFKLTDPFETCPLCAYKHLSYALIKYLNNEKERFIGQIYLAYRHLNLNFKMESEICFTLILNYFNNEILINNLKETIDKIHDLAIKFKENEEDFKNDLDLKLENQLDNSLKAYLYLLACNELYNFEVGYKDINSKYVIGLLQECAELEGSLIWKDRIRSIWKDIENDSLDPNSFLAIADQILYRYNKDITLQKILEEKQ